MLASTLLATLPVPAAPTLAAQLQSAAKSGGVVILDQSIKPFAVQVKVSRGRTLTLKAVRPVTLDGGGAEYGLRVSSGGRVVLEGPITMRGFAKNAIRATLCESVTLNGVTFRNTGQAAVLTGKCKAVRIEGCTAEDSKSHAFYVSEGGSNVVIRGNTVRRVGSIAYHVNSCPYRGSNVSILNNTAVDVGNAAIQVTSIDRATIAGNSFARCRQGVSVYDDGRRKCRCVGVDLRNQVGPYTIARSSVAVLLPPTAARTATLARERRPAQ